MDIRVSTYKRLIQTTKAERILNSCNIHFDRMDLLISNKYGSELAHRILCNIDDNDCITLKYSSRNKITNRLFQTKNPIVNILTLSDKVILKAINSRYEDGKIVQLDYSQFEITIIGHLLDIEEMKQDFHDWASRLLNVNRDVAKRLNMWLLYTRNFDGSINRLRKFDLVKENLEEYIEKMSSIRHKVDTYTTNLSFENGFVVNSYGRKIYPSDRSNIFNNVIQSIASEILVDCIVQIHEYIKKYNDVSLMFHKFDSVYLDFKCNKSIIKHLGKIKNIMENVTREQIPLKVKISIGENLTSLKELDIE